MLIGTYSPLCRVFIPKFQNELIENPDLIFEDVKENFEISIYRPVGDYLMKFKQPREEQNAVMIEWLTGGDDGCLSPETDQYGIVKITKDVQDTGEFLSLLDDENLTAARIKEIQRQFKSSVSMARTLSEFRVMRAVETVYVSIRKQWIANDENKFGKHIPTKSEYLCLKIMERHFKNNKNKEVDMAKKMQEVIEGMSEDNLNSPLDSEQLPSNKLHSKLREYQEKRGV